MSSLCFSLDITYMVSSDIVQYFMNNFVYDGMVLGSMQ